LQGHDALQGKEAHAWKYQVHLRAVQAENVDGRDYAFLHFSFAQAGSFES
jgi:hypothetical protein